MKANELMIGDWVRSPKNADGDFYAAQVCEIKQGGEHYYCYIPGPDGNDSIRCDDISPIPLSQEILEKNGFYVKREFNGGVIEETCLLDKSRWISFTMYGFRSGWFCEWARIGCRLHISNIDKSNEFCGTVKYVHELQHAMRLCGIDKEITL